MSSGRSKKFVFVFALIIAIGLYRMAGCGAEAPSDSSTSSASTPMVWPPPGETVALASNPTTRNYYVIIDGSGSMSNPACQGAGSKIEQSRVALTAFAQGIGKNTNLGLLAFDNQGVSERIALATDNREQFIHEVKKVIPSGQTPLADSIRKGREALEQQARRQLGYGEYNLVIVTDGEASSGQDPSGEVDSLLRGTPIILHTIGFCIGTRHSLNQPGRTIYKAANSPDELQRGLDEVLAESPSFDVKQFN